MPPSARMLLALLDGTPELSAALATEWPKWRDRLRALLSRLDVDGETAALDDDVQTLFEQLVDETPAAPIVSRIVDEDAVEDGFVGPGSGLRTGRVGYRGRDPHQTGVGANETGSRRMYLKERKTLTHARVCDAFERALAAVP